MNPIAFIVFVSGLAFGILCPGCDSGGKQCELFCDKLVTECQASADTMEECLDGCTQARDWYRSDVYSGLTSWVIGTSCEEIEATGIENKLVVLIENINDDVIIDLIGDICKKMAQCNSQITVEACKSYFDMNSEEFEQQKRLLKALKPQFLQCISDQFSKQDCVAISTDFNAVLEDCVIACGLNFEASTDQPRTP